MTFHDHYLRIYRAHFSGVHGFGASHLAIMAILASDPDRKFKQQDLAYMLGISEQSITSLCRRLFALGMIDGDSLSIAGRVAMGVDAGADRLRPLDIAPPSSRRGKPLVRLPVSTTTQGF